MKPLPPGGISDIAARIVGAKLTEAFGQQCAPQYLKCRRAHKARECERAGSDNPAHVRPLPPERRAPLRSQGCASSSLPLACSVLMPKQKDNNQSEDRGDPLPEAHRRALVRSEER